MTSTLADVARQKLHEYDQHHAVHGYSSSDIPIAPIKSTNMREITSNEWDACFADSFDGHNQLLFQVLILDEARNGITPLIRLLSAKVASKIKGKSPEEIKAILSAD